MSARVFKRILLAAALLVVMPLLFGCESSGYLMRVEREGYTAYTFTLRLSASEERLLNESAVQRGVRRANGNAWQAVEYLTFLGAMAGFEVSIDRGEDPFTYLAFIRSVRNEAASDGAQSRATDMPLQLYNRNIFIVTYRYKGVSPINSYRAQYDAPPLGSLFHVFQFGIEDKFPAFKDAFPLAESSVFNANNFRVSFILRTRSRYSVGGNNTRTFNRASGYFYYTFTARFDNNSNNQVEFFLNRPNPLGWYLLAILLGLLSVGAVIMVVKLKNKI